VVLCSAITAAATAIAIVAYKRKNSTKDVTSVDLTTLEPNPYLPMSRAPHSAAKSNSYAAFRTTPEGSNESTAALTSSTKTRTAMKIPDKTSISDVFPR
jgi:hypothetical protein